METQRADDVVLAEAAAWIARLQGSQRSPATEAAFREWLNADAAHARAFARATDVWDVIAGAARLNARPQNAPTPNWTRRAVFAGIAACTVFGVVALGIATYLKRAGTYVTAPGHQETFTLDDGTRISLNTDSKLEIDYSGMERRVHLRQGEGIFRVAKDAARPFIVQAGEEQVRALGTTFVVRKDPAALAVTLIEGRIEISKRADLVLAPGERAIMQPGASVSVDRPEVEAVTAWQRGEVMFDDVSLQTAASEINRYGNPHVLRVSPDLAALRVSGVFETRNPDEFAEAMARLHALRVQRHGDEIVLTAP